MNFNNDVHVWTCERMHKHIRYKLISLNMEWAAHCSHEASLAAELGYRTILINLIYHTKINMTRS